MSGKQEKTVTNLNIEVECLLTAKNVLMFSKLFKSSEDTVSGSGFTWNEQIHSPWFFQYRYTTWKNGRNLRSERQHLIQLPLPPPVPCWKQSSKLSCSRSWKQTKETRRSPTPRKKLSFCFSWAKAKSHSTNFKKILTNSYQVCWGSGFWSLNNKAVDTKEDPHSMRNRIIHVDQKVQHSKAIYIFNKPVKS